MLLVVAIAWVYVVAMMAAAEATSSSGSLLGALFIVLGYGVVPLGIALYLLATPARRRRAAQASTVSVDPDRGGHPAGDTVAPERIEP